MEKLLLTAVFFGLLGSFSNLYARTGNWQPAYVIVNENDTLFGQIDFRSSRVNQERVLFRKDEHSQLITFSPNDILGYRFTPDGKFYVSRTINIGENPRKTFVEFMVKGVMSLYHYVDENRRSHYLLESENDRNFLITREDDGRFSLIREHRNMGMRIVTHNTNIDEMIRREFQYLYPIANHSENFRFNQQSMVNLATAYHNLVCPLGEKNIIFENVAKLQMKITVYTAFEQYVFNFDAIGTETTHLHSAIAIGAEAVFIYPQFSRNTGFYVDLSITQLFNNELIIERPNAFSGGDYYRKIDFDITTRAGVKYFYTFGKFTPGAKLGVSLQCLVGESRFNGAFDNLLVSPGIHVGLGTEYRLKNRNALSLYFQLDRYGKIERGTRWRDPTLTLSVYGLRLGYMF